MIERCNDDIYWEDRNESDKTVVLYGSNGTPFSFAPGEIFVPPKQVEALNAFRTHKATLLDGGMGGGKSIAAAMCIHDFVTDLSAPGHTHGLDPAPCNVAHEKLYVFLIGQTLTDIRRRNLPHLLDRYGDFGTLNKNEWEFTYHDVYGSHVIMMIGSDDPKKMRGTKGAMAFHDECTLDSNFRDRFRMTLKRLRQAGIPHTPWIGATNTTGPSRNDVKDIFIDNPRPAYRDKAKGRIFPGYTHIHSTIYDNPYMDPAVVYEMEQGTEFEVQAYVHGSWEHPEGAMFQLEPGVHTVDPFPIEDDWPMAIGMDFGWGHPTVCESWCQDPVTKQLVHNLVWSESRMSDMKAKLSIYEYFKDSGFPIERATVRVGDIAASRGGSKMTESQMENSTAWHIFNSETKHGNITLPSFRMRPAWKGRVEGWRAVREEFDYEWEWAVRDPKLPLSEGNRRRKTIQEPTAVIHNTCWQTAQSFIGLQHHKTKQDDHQETTGTYGPGKGDDEAVTARYIIMAFRKRKFGGTKQKTSEEWHDPRRERRKFQSQLRGTYGRSRVSTYAG